MAGTVREFCAIVACCPAWMSGIRATGTLNVTLAGPDPITMTAVDAETVSPAEKDNCATTPSIGDVMVAFARLAWAWLRAVCACWTWAWAVATLTDPEEEEDPEELDEAPPVAEADVDVREVDELDTPEAPARAAIVEASRDPSVEVSTDPPEAVPDPPVEAVPDPDVSGTEHCWDAALSARACCAA